MSDNVTVSNSPTSINADIPVRTLDKGTTQTQVVAIDYGAGGAENLTVPDFATETTLASIDGKVATEATLASINSQIIGGITATLNSDVLGAAVTAVRNNEVEISFFDSFNSDIITNTTASGGSATIVGGHARYRTGTNATGTAKGVSVYSCKYRPAHEQYCFFTAAFTTGVANSYQRIGLYDTNNGFFIGYEGTSFGVTLRTGASDTTIARASWNGDPLDGLAGSLFTRGGSPEAINLTYSNLYRIRFAWLGSASIYFEVFSPDGNWVTFHTIKIPNSQLDPSIQNPELPITIDIKKFSGATDLSLYTACVASGTTSADFPINETLNEYSLAKLTRSVITGETSAGGGGYVNVKVTPSGSLTIALGDIDGVSGQETMADSLPVVIASDQSAIPVTGTLSISTTGLATDTNQTTQISHLSSIDGNLIKADTDNVTIASALPAGTNNIGDVDVLTLPNVTLASQANPFTTAIPISDDGGSITVDGSVAASQSGTWDITNITGTVSLPTGAATETTLQNIDSKITTCNTGAVTISAALPSGNNNIGHVDVDTLPNITLASQANPFTSAIPISDDGNSITVDGTIAATQSGTWNLTNITGTVSLPTGAATESTLSTLDGKITACNTGAVTLTSQSNPFTSAIPISDDGGSLTVDGTVAATQSGTWNINNISGTVSLPTGAATESTLSTLNGKVTACNTGSVTLASQANPFTSALPVEPETVSTSSVSSTSASASSVTVLASNANRKLAIFVNDADKIAYVKLGGTASATSYSYKLQPNSTLELAQPVYTGVVDAIWETGPTGAMRVTELT